MRHTKLAALAVAGTAAALALAGCSGGSSSGGATTGGSAAGSSPITLNLWTGFTGGDRPGYEQIVSDWNAAHPDIQVKMDVQSWDTIQTKLPGRLAHRLRPGPRHPQQRPQCRGRLRQDELGPAHHRHR